MVSMIFIVLHMQYEQYTFQRYINSYEANIAQLEKKIESAKVLLEHKKTPAYKNKILKLWQERKNKWEKVYRYISEDDYNIYTRVENSAPSFDLQYDTSDKANLLETMTPYQKWVYLIFKKDIR